MYSYKKYKKLMELRYPKAMRKAARGGTPTFVRVDTEKAWKALDVYIRKQIIHNLTEGIDLLKDE